MGSKGSSMGSGRGSGTGNKGSRDNENQSRSPGYRVPKILREVNNHNNMHGIEIVCNADRSDWGRKWGYGKEGDGLCWCYECTMKRLDEQEYYYPDWESIENDR